MKVSGLDLLGSLPVLDGKRNDIIDWIYGMQICHESTETAFGHQASLSAFLSLPIPFRDRVFFVAHICGPGRLYFGFRGGSFLGCPFNSACCDSPVLPYETGESIS